jgi:hypothetical protein
MVNSLTVFDADILAQIAEQSESITDQRLCALLSVMSGDGARIAVALAGRTQDPDPTVNATVRGLKNWAQANRAIEGSKKVSAVT